MSRLPGKPQPEPGGDVGKQHRPREEPQGDDHIDGAERSALRSQQAVESLRHAVGYSAADEIEKLNRLKQAGSITDDEFTRLRSRVVQ